MSVGSVQIDMSKPWFYTEEQGVIQVTRRDTSWYVEEPETEGQTVCFFASNTMPESDSEEVSVSVENFRQAAGSGSNYLTVQVMEDGETQTENPVDDPNHAQGGDHEVPSKDSYPERNLVQFDGSGDYVTVEAEIHRIEYVEKNKSKMPDMKGVLKERGSTKKLPFVISHGVKHPYFEAGTRFRFEGVKDHRYKQQNQIQALITEGTNFTEL